MFLREQSGKLAPWRKSESHQRLLSHATDMCWLISGLQGHPPILPPCRITTWHLKQTRWKDLLIPPPLSDSHRPERHFPLRVYLSAQKGWFGTTRGAESFSETFTPTQIISFSSGRKEPPCDQHVSHRAEQVCRWTECDSLVTWQSGNGTHVPPEAVKLYFKSRVHSESGRSHSQAKFK